MFKIFAKSPILLAVVVMLFMYAIGETDIALKYDFQYQEIISLAILIISILIIAIGVYSFQKAKTTFNPMTPEKAAKLVKTGVYKYSRNPMYFGFLAWLVAWAIFIGNPVNILLLPLYVLLVNKLYIIPEEMALENLFKNEFREYRSKVRRWI